jgi:hypothetical protein
MRRYGDNISAEDISDEQPLNEKDQFTRVLYGGCAVGYGSFPRPDHMRNKSKNTKNSQSGLLTGILTFLGIKVKKSGG